MNYRLPTILLLSLSASQPLLAANFADWSSYEQEVFSLVNVQRGLNGLKSLVADSRLQDAAVEHSTDMSVNNFFSHTGSDGSSGGDRISSAGYHWTGWGENIAAGYGVTYSGGQIAMGPAEDSARLVMYGSASLSDISAFSVNNGLAAFSSWSEVGTHWTDTTWDAWQSFNGGSGGWMGSSGHRHNILTDWFTDLGVGLTFNASPGSSYHAYWTQNFAAGDTAPVPAPSAVWLFAGGMGLLRLVRKKTSLA